MTQREKMMAGDYYDSSDPALRKDRDRARRLTRRLQDIDPADDRARNALYEELFGRAGEGLHIEAPFFCDYGYNIEWGERSYANFGCVILDGARVTIGSNVLLAPNVGLYTAAHPVDPRLRLRWEKYEYARPITIGDNVWIGGGSIVLPGVTIGENAVIGAGSIVTHDIPAGVVAAGNPCRVLHPVKEGASAIH
jgi:maltose O-acetyltransferase